MNVIFLGSLMIFVTLPSWSWTGFVVFVAAGLMTTWLGRGTSYMAIRLLGPARQGAILVSAPFFAAIIGWLFLGESVTLIQALGGILISIGLLVLLRSRLKVEEKKERVALLSDVGAASAAEVVSSRPERIRAAVGQDDFVRGFILALVAAVFFGAGFVVRKWGLTYYPHAAAGAFFGACTAMAMILLRSIISGRLEQLIHENLREVPWWFVAGGTTSSIAVFLQFSALDHLPAWIVSLLQGTQAIWTLLWAWLFLRQEEQIGSELITSIVLVVSGVAIITYGV